MCQQCSLAGSCHLGWPGSPHLPRSRGICGCGTSPLRSSGSSLFPPAAPGSFPDGLEISGHASELLYLLSAPAKISIPTLWKNIRQPDIKEWCEGAELGQGSTNMLYEKFGIFDFSTWHFFPPRLSRIMLRILGSLLISARVISTGCW